VLQIQIGTAFPWISFPPLKLERFQTFFEISLMRKFQVYHYVNRVALPAFQETAFLQVLFFKILISLFITVALKLSVW